MTREEILASLDTPKMGLKRFIREPNTEETYVKMEMEDIIRVAALYIKYGCKCPHISDLDEGTVKLITQLGRELKIKGFFYENELEEPGRPKLWAGMQGCLFWVQVRLMQETYPEASLRSNIRRVITKYKYKDSLNSLYVRYNELIKNPSQMLQDYWCLCPDCKEDSPLPKEKRIEKLEYALKTMR